MENIFKIYFKKSLKNKILLKIIIITIIIIIKLKEIIFSSVLKIKY